MKHIIALLAAAFAALSTVNTADARTCGSQVYVSGRTSCGCPVYAERYVAYYDSCGHPVYQVRHLPVTHRCRPVVPCRPSVRHIVPPRPVPYRPQPGWGRSTGHGHGHGHGRCR